MKNYDTTIKADLRKKNTFDDSIRFSSIDIQACMVIFAVAAILLLSVISVVMAPNPYFI
ncbi:hypothetical protein [Methanobrevibacter sp.]|uniref:hypothetical protein n=1 Tax=Methanobrevibacter sp. TaxID=66852 RepID=UPI0026DF91D0|nr:hypothetical protein [Methanobrevibacter sp.]